MTITQTVEIPNDYRIFLDLPRSVPSGIVAKVNIDIPIVSTRDSKSFWAEFDAKAAASEDEILDDDNFVRTSTSRELKLVSDITSLRGTLHDLDTSNIREEDDRII